MTCRSCAKEIPGSSRFCLCCGADVNGAAAQVTETVAATPHGTRSTPAPARSSSNPSLSSSSGSLAEGRFTPGALKFPPEAAAVFVLSFTALKSVSSDYPALEWPAQAVLYAVLAAGALRYGLVTLVVALYTADAGLNIPATLNTSAWYFNDSTSALASIAALAVWGFYTALGPRREARLSS